MTQFIGRESYAKRRKNCKLYLQKAHNIVASKDKTHNITYLLVQLYTYTTTQLLCGESYVWSNPINAVNCFYLDNFHLSTYLVFTFVKLKTSSHLRLVITILLLGAMCDIGDILNFTYLPNTRTHD